MKATAFAGALAMGILFAGFAGGHPHRIKRDIVTEVTFTTVTVSNVIVYVDENGIPYETTTVDQIPATDSTVAGASATTSAIVPNPTPVEPTLTPSSATPAPSALPSFVVIPDSVATSAPAETHAPEVTSSLTPVESQNSYVAPAPAPSSQAPEVPSSAVPAPSSQAAEIPSSSPVPASPTGAQAASGGAFPLGVTYDPFKPGGCKTESEIADEFNRMKEFGIVRIYGMGCGIVPLAIKYAKANNQKIMAGIYRSKDPNNNERIDDVVKTLKDAINQYAGGNWDMISAVSVENEKVNSHEMTASDAVSIIQQARNALKGAGYNGPVGAVETVPATVDNPSVCTESDLAFVNIHAFFDENTEAKNAGDFVKGQIAQVKQSCQNKRVIVTESGWPHQGDSHGKAVASPEAQKAAMDSIRSAFDHDLFLFNGFDSPWKNDDSTTHNAEKFWGVL